ncbi:hypothetical protein ACOSP7_026938 [Xanthoceras sorbifolium]
MSSSSDRGCHKAGFRGSSSEEGRKLCYFDKALVGYKRFVSARRTGHREDLTFSARPYEFNVGEYMASYFYVFVLEIESLEYRRFASLPRELPVF